VTVGSVIGGERLRQIAYLTLAAACLAAVWFFAWYRSTYWVFPGQDASQRLHWCGRDYDLLPGPAMTWRQISASDPSWPVHIVDLFPPLGIHKLALFASINPALARTPRSQITSCTTVIYVRIGPSRYDSYSLLGGP